MNRILVLYYIDTMKLADIVSSVSSDIQFDVITRPGDIGLDIYLSDDLITDVLIACRKANIILDSRPEIYNSKGIPA